MGLVIGVKVVAEGSSVGVAPTMVPWLPTEVKVPTSTGEPAVSLLEPDKLEYTILDALAELSAGKKGTLMLENKESGDTYQVASHIQGGKTVLTSPTGVTLRVWITKREARLYTPFWR